MPSRRRHCAHVIGKRPRLFPGFAPVWVSSLNFKLANTKLLSLRLSNGVLGSKNFCGIMDQNFGPKVGSVMEKYTSL